jgi:hypothetical protein
VSGCHDSNLILTTTTRHTQCRNLANPGGWKEKIAPPSAFAVDVPFLFTFINYAPAILQIVSVKILAEDHPINALMTGAVFPSLSFVMR